MNESQVSVPLSVRLRFGHAALQFVADNLDIDLLHIKGAAADPSLRPSGYAGTDVDVLVRPSQFQPLDAALRRHGWRLYSTFAAGSPFGHAQTYTHDNWGYVDVHRFFPGIRLTPDAAFERMWRDRGETEIATVGCPVPSIDAQSVMLLLNAARSGPSGNRDVDVVWNKAPEEGRARIEALVGELAAQVAFAAAVGGLDRFRGERDYLLWKVVSQGGSRTTEWWARVRAAPSFAESVRVVVRAPLVNVEHLAHRLGRQPTRLEIIGEFFGRQARAVGEAWRGVRHRGSRRRGAAL